MVRGFVALVQHQLRRPFRMLLPERLDPVVGLVPLRHGRSPVAEDGAALRRGCGWRWDRQDLAERDAAPGRPSAPGAVVTESRNRPRLLVLVVVAVPAAVVLCRGGTSGSRPRRETRSAFPAVKTALRGMVAPARADVDAPGGLVLAVDGEADRPGHPLACRCCRRRSLPAAFPAD